MKKESIQSIIMNILKIYVILMVFIVPQDKTGLVIWASILIPICLYLMFQILKTNSAKTNKWYAFCWIALIAIVIFNILLSEYSTAKLIQNTLQLFVLSLFIGQNNSEEKRRIDFFYIIMTIFLVYNIVTNYLNNNVLTFTNFADTNYASVIVFLYFLYSIENHYKIGILTALFYLVINFSRLYIVGLIAFIIILIISKTKILTKIENTQFTTKKVFSIICFMIIFTFALSYFWTNFIVGSATSHYKQSLNDTSNAIRMNANLYALKIIKNDHNIIWRGYDSDIKSALGLDSDLIEEHKTYAGFRIVQPHNSYLNPILTHGILYTIFYFIIVSKILSELINYKNMKIWGPYFVMCLFMHSLLSTFFLVFFVIVLISKQEDDKFIEKNDKMDYNDVQGEV